MIIITSDRHRCYYCCCHLSYSIGCTSRTVTVALFAHIITVNENDLLSFSFTLHYITLHYITLHYVTSPPSTIHTRSIIIAAPFDPPSIMGVITTAAVGGLVGFSAQCVSNAIQKIPLSRREWNAYCYYCITHDDVSSTTPGGWDWIVNIIRGLFFGGGATWVGLVCHLTVSMLYAQQHCCCLSYLLLLFVSFTLHSFHQWPLFLGWQ
jgi:hypothetical protein